MENKGIYVANSPALAFARKHLKQAGLPIREAPGPDTAYILLPVPTTDLPENIPDGATLIGGNIQEGIDLLQDEDYLDANAAITAQGAIQLAMEALPICLWEAKILILGYGRIGKHLSQLLKGLGCGVTVAARKKKVRTLAEAAGHEALPIKGLDPSPFRLVFNTVPAKLRLSPEIFDPTAVKIDLASVKALPGEDVLWARGLPGKEYPESSGALIARRVQYYINKE